MTDGITIDARLLGDLVAHEVIRIGDLIELLQRPRIHGVEITQSMQYYRAAEHLSDSADWGPDNSVRLVAGKPAWIRVYLRSFIGPMPGVTGRVTVRRRHQGFLYVDQLELLPQPPGSVTAQATADYATERGSISSTLNFIVPADEMCGNLRFVVEVQAPSGHTSTETVTVDVTLRQTLRLRIIPVSYNGPDTSGTGTLNIAVPTLADAQATTPWSLLVYPVESTPQISFAAAVQLTYPLDTWASASAGGCPTNWNTFLTTLAQARTADGNLPNRLYYGLIPAAVPGGGGCSPGNSMGAGFVGQQGIMAHELGHGLGYPHSPCGSVGTPDPTYPAYEPYDPSGVPGASIGEYGLDVNTGQVMSPATFRDYMSYCAPAWIGLFNYQRSIDHASLNPTTCGEDRPWWADEILVDPKWWIFRRPWPEPDPPPWYKEVVQFVDPREPLISIIGVRSVTGEVEVRSLTRVMAARTPPGRRHGSLVAELLSEEGELLARAPAFRLTGQGCGGCRDHGGDDEDEVAFQSLLPSVEGAAGIRLMDGEQEVWRRNAPAEPPSTPSLTAEVRRTGLQLRWKLDRGDQDAEVWVRWRASGREEPAVLTIGRGSGRATVGLDQVPPGKIELDVVAHDGFHVAEGEAVTVEIPAQPPAVTILHPIERRTLVAGRDMRLHGLATSADGSRVGAEACTWQIDGKEVAHGLDVFVTAPPAGEHRVVLSARDDAGKAQAAASFTTVAGAENGKEGSAPQEPESRRGT
ncbi:MAG TPA: hypothetical protein VEQ37_21315 [Actinomycetota bacterium]|nr:hypothetical protein [Actinomycetota bacterium]